MVVYLHRPWLNCTISFRLSRFRAISGPQYFTGHHVWILLNSPYRFPREGSHSFEIKIVCFERQVKSFDSLFGNAWEIQNPIKWPFREREIKSTSDAIFTFQRGEQNLSIMHFDLPSRGLTLEGFPTFIDFCLRWLKKGFPTHSKT